MAPTSAEGPACAWLGEIIPQRASACAFIVVDEHSAANHFDPSRNIEVLAGQADFLLQFGEFEHGIGGDVTCRSFQCWF